MIRRAPPLPLAAALLLLLLFLLPSQAAAQYPIDLSQEGQSHLIEQESSAIVGVNLTYNVTLDHRVYYHAPFELPPWLWVLFLVGGTLILLFSLLWNGALQINWLTSVLSLLFLFVAEFTSFVIRDISFETASTYAYFGQETLPVLLISVQPVVIAWDWIIPFFFTMGILVVAILNFMVITLEMGGPGLRYFRANIFRRG